MFDLSKALTQIVTVVTLTTMSSAGGDTRGVKTYAPLDLKPTGIHRLSDERDRRDRGVKIIKRFPLFVK